MEGVNLLPLGPGYACRDPHRGCYLRRILEGYPYNQHYGRPLFSSPGKTLPMHTLKLILQWLLGVLFVLAGINHFARPRFYVAIMPPYLPWHLELVYLSGLCEVVLGALLLVPRFTHLAAWGLVALLVAVFPANLHMAVHPELYPRISPVLLWVRLPLQGVLIAWAWWYTRVG
jgi:uncharacterized membrane protein